jgi:hypothetical protein
MKEAGFIHIQTGIESLSSSYLKKMNKGTKVIENIATLKFCRENGIKNDYNFIIRYPNEDKIDFKETKENIELIKYYIDPPNINNLLIGIGSPIFEHPERYNILCFKHTNVDTLMFPKQILEEGISFYYDYVMENNVIENNWTEVINSWRKEREKSIINCIKSNLLIDNFIFYFVDGKDFLKIYDKRDPNNVRIMILDNIEREIFLFCNDIKSIEDLKEKFSDIPDYQLFAILHTFEKANIVFVEDKYYLSLPLDYKKCLGLEIKSNELSSREEIIA